MVRYIAPCPQAVYVRGNKLYSQCCSCLGGYPIANITAVEVIRGGQILFLYTRFRVSNPKGATVHILNQGESVDHGVPRWNYRTLEFTGVRITGSDGTKIAFAATSEEAEVFAQQLRSAADVARTTELQQNIIHPA